MKKVKKILGFVFLIALAFIVFALVLIGHRPSQYAPVTNTDVNQISPYLTNQILPMIYNGAQRGEPFDITISQQGINDIISRFREQIKTGNLTITAPQIIFSQNQITLMVTVKNSPIDLFATMECEPAINQKDKMVLHIKKISIGLLNITRTAKSKGNKLYSNWLILTGTEPDNIAAQVFRSLLNDEPFDPVFEFADKKIRVSKINITKESMTLQLTPFND